MPYTTVVAGTTITAAWANTNVRDQVISTFASEAARNAAITTPTDGLFAYTQDTNRLWRHDGSNWVLMGGNMPRSDARRAGGAFNATSGVLQVMPWTSATQSDASMWTAGNASRVIAPVAGLYIVSYALSWSGSGGGLGDRQGFVMINGIGSRFATATETMSAGTQACQLTGAATVVLAANDYVELWMFQNSGGVVTTNGAGTDHLILGFVGPAG